ncbi:MAG: hypothetical protein ABSC46_12650 [Candidatus Limnocylindrales bacterium]|jgi:hypothetical protein
MEAAVLAAGAFVAGPGAAGVDAELPQAARTAAIKTAAAVARNADGTLVLVTVRVIPILQ